MHPSLLDVQRAQGPVAQVAHRTPLFPSRTFSQLCEAQVFLKAENLQRTGSFKVRGAANRIARLSPAQRRQGVIAASAGNHAQGVALASQQTGIPCTIVMPKGASIAKMEATRNYSAQVVLHGETFDEAQAHAQRLAEEGGFTFISAFDDPEVIAGQGTLGLEVCEDLPEVEAVVVPVGGGGLIAGVALTVKALRPGARVFGVQVDASPAAAISFRQGRQVTMRAKPSIADGIAIGRPGALPLQLMAQYVDDVVTVSEEEVAHAMLLLLERAKLLVEGAGAVGVAALLGKRIPCLGQKVAVVLSGGNVDPNLLAHVLEHGRAHAGRYLVLWVVLPDLPGQLALLAEAISRAEANVIDVAHRRRGIHIGMDQVQVEITVETRDAAHAAQVAASLGESGYLAQEPPAPLYPGSILHFVAREALARDS
ncbi:MAG: threonine ammonia-lyase [Chloroflexi bacterium]|nr:threonine ammonia-lyase [Chloroflexota bacterium]